MGYLVQLVCYKFDKVSVFTEKRNFHFVMKLGIMVKYNWVALAFEQHERHWKLNGWLIRRQF